MKGEDKAKLGKRGTAHAKRSSLRRIRLVASGLEFGHLSARQAPRFSSAGVSRATSGPGGNRRFVSPAPAAGAFPAVDRQGIAASRLPVLRPARPPVHA